MNILILGGTGAMGRHVIEFLKVKKYNILLRVEIKEKIKME